MFISLLLLPFCQIKSYFLMRWGVPAQLGR